jgi:hypothetical protein
MSKKIKVNTKELIGDALDWAVCKASYDDLAALNIEYPEQSKHYPRVSPSTDWSIGGKIIDKECIEIHNAFSNDRVAYAKDSQAYSFGETTLIAAMRCFVVTRYGNTILVPESLVE